MRTIHIEYDYQVGTFNELSSEIQKKVIEENRYFNVEGFDWWEYVYDDFINNIAVNAGIDVDNISFSGFYSQGDGAAFKGECKNFKKFLDYANCPVAYREKLEYYKAEQYVNHMFADNRGYSGNNQFSDIEFFYDDDCDLPENQLVIDWLFKAWDTVCESLSAELYENLQKEYEYQISDEAVSESLICSETEFNTETGSIE